MSLTVGEIQRSAILFLDFQKDVSARGGKMVNQSPEVLRPFEETVEHASLLLNKVRESDNGPRVVHVRHIYQPGYPELNGARLSGMENYVKSQDAFIDGSDGASVVESLRPSPGEFTIGKRTLSPFASTELGWWLRKRDINTVILAGVVTHYVILATAIAAYDMGLNVVVLSDCCMSGTPESHGVALDILGPIATIVASTDILGLIE